MNLYNNLTEKVKLFITCDFITCDNFLYFDEQALEKMNLKAELAHLTRVKL